MVVDKNFREFIALLNANNVKYLIVGGYAVGFHGYPRYTKDLDVWVSPDSDNARRLVDPLLNLVMEMRAFPRKTLKVKTE